MKCLKINEGNLKERQIAPEHKNFAEGCYLSSGISNFRIRDYQTLIKLRAKNGYKWNRIEIRKEAIGAIIGEN